MQKHRILTNIGGDKKVTLELKQDYELLEILSLKFTQQQAYTSFCSDYGVVCGRISVNNGLGIPNARVSIFVPQKDIHANDPVISALYPYTQISDKDDNGYRYNLLPKRQQHGGHAPTGTFFDQNDILAREEILEVYETYYSYTVKTNNAGDFMIWGVPLGNQTIHVDIDLSDIGCFSQRPYDFIRQGAGVDKFKNKYSFKASEDFNTLPQIVTFDKSIEVYPFWGNEEFCEIGITRTDFDLSERGIKIEPKAFIIGGQFTDSGKNSINKNCTPRKKMGRKCDLVPKSGIIEAIRFTTAKDENHRPILEAVDLHEDIPDDGSFVFPINMNMDYLYTNEFGDNEITNDPNKGVPTSACYRFRFNMADNGLDRVRANADFLVPNIREYHTGNTITNESVDDKSYAWSLDWNDYPSVAVTNDPNIGILYNEYGEYYPKDYFYRFNYNKVYTVSSFHSHYISSNFFGTVGFANINEAHPPEEEDCGDKLTPPTNFGNKNYTFTLLIADVLLAIENLFNIVILLFFNVLSKLFVSIGQSFQDTCFLGICPLGGLGRWMRTVGYSLMDSGQKGLQLVAYPECEECNAGENGVTSQGVGNINYCVVGEVKYITKNIFGNLITYIEGLYNYTNIPNGYITFTQPTNGECTGSTIPLSFNGFLSTQQNYGIKTNTGVYPLSQIYTEGGLYVHTGNYFGLNYTGISDSNSTLITGEGIFTYPIVNLSYSDTGIITGNTATIEDGCASYDTPYDETLISLYYTQIGLTESQRGGTTNYTPGMNVVATNTSDSDGYALPTSYNGKTFHRTTISGKSEFANGIFYMVPGSQSNGRLLSLINEYYRRKRVGKMFCGGIVNYGYIDNWLSGSLYFPQLKIKRITQAITQKSEGAARYCRGVARLVVGQGRLYYKSASTTNGTTFTTGQINRPTTFVDLGPRDEFIKEICVDPTLDPNCSVSRSIGPTSYQDIGELLALIINYRMDVTNASGNLDTFFQNKGFSINNGIKNLSGILNGDILQLLSINNETGIEGFDLQNPKYLGYNYTILDPEVFPQVFKNGNQNFGPTPVTFDLNEDGERVRACLNEVGRLTESSQKVPFYLWDKKGTGFGSYDDNQYNQTWDYGTVQTQSLQGMTYGYTLTGTNDDPSDKYLLLPMTYTFSGLTIPNQIAVTGITHEFDRVITGTTNGTTIPVGTLLHSYNNEYPGFTVLSVTAGTLNEPTGGVLYTRVGNAGTNGITGWASGPWALGDFIIRPTQDYYGSKQILSTPFQFYFGLMAGKTGLDKFIDLFGPKGAFPSAE
jgi:hypothetical protein